MRLAGYTLIELLVVISIISILAVVGFVNFKGFSSDQVTIKAVGEIQTYLRLAQSNATSSTLCGRSGGAAWSLIFRSNQQTLDLACGPTNFVQKTYTMENAKIDSITGSAGSDCGGPAAAILPFTITYSTGVGAVSFSSSQANQTCLASGDWTFTIRNTLDTAKTKIFKLSKGGAIDVQ